jgi:hypothetical protein
MSSNTKEYNRKYYLENKDKALSKVKTWQENNKDKVKENTKLYREKNKEKILEWDKEWKNQNPEYHKEYNKKWKNQNPEYHKEYLKNNREYINQRVALNSKKRREENTHIKLQESIRSTIQRKIKNKTKKSIEYLGCSYEEYKIYLEKQFDENMTWDNYGSYWEIDHLIPLSKNGSFHYINTRPLSVTENRKKYNKL